MDDPGRRLRTASWWALAGLLAAVAITGAWLSVGYRPGELAAVRAVHRWAGLLAIFPAGSLVGALAIADATSATPPNRRRTALAAAGSALLVLALAGAALSGFPLAWDQVAMREVTVGTDVRGFGFLFDDSAAFVLAGGVEVSTGTFRRVLVMHAVVLPAVALAGIAVLRRTARRTAPRA
jgi:quinol-cytochrome oxidoreductase complex cytochrome b subunit